MILNSLMCLSELILDAPPEPPFIQKALGWADDLRNRTRLPPFAFLHSLTTEGSGGWCHSAKPVLRKRRRLALTAERQARRRKSSTTSGPSRSDRSARASGPSDNTKTTISDAPLFRGRACGRQSAALSLRWLRLYWDNRAPARGSQSRYAARCRGYQRGPIHAACDGHPWRR
jgi:hypothetical protein